MLNPSSDPFRKIQGTSGAIPPSLFESELFGYERGAFSGADPYFPVGGTQLKTANCRIVAATNRDLKGMAAEAKFREDLYYRLNVVSIDIPPLRDRKEDIYDLAQSFLSG